MKKKLNKDLVEQESFSKFEAVVDDTLLRREI
jgi:hypothetical protein